MTKRKMCLLGAIIAGFAMVSQVQGAVQNAAWLQGSFLDNGGNELAATAAAPLTISWTSVSSIDTGIFEHSFITPTKLTVKADGDYFVAFNGPHVLSGTPQRATSIFQVFVNGAGVGGALSQSTYLRNAGNHTEASAHFSVLVPGLSAGDEIEIKTWRVAVTDPGTQLQTASLYVERVDASETVFAATATGTVGGVDVNLDFFGAGRELAWTSVRADVGITHSGGSHEINLSAGRYLVFVNVPITSAGVRVSPAIQITLDGLPVTNPLGEQGYIRNASGHTSASLHWGGLVIADGAQTLTVETIQRAVAGEVTIPDGQPATILVQQLDGASGVFSNASTIDDLFDYNLVDPTPIFWNDDPLGSDTAVYDHTDFTAEITVKQAGSYLVIYNDNLEGGGARANPLIRINVNGEAVDGAELKSHYIRQAGGHSAASGTMTFLLDDLSANDVITFTTEAEGGEGSTYGPLAAAGSIVTIIKKPAFVGDPNDPIPSRLVSFEVTSNGFEAQLEDAALALNPETVTATVDGQAVETEVTKVGGTTTVTFNNESDFDVGNHVIIVNWVDATDPPTPRSFDVAFFTPAVIELNAGRTVLDATKTQTALRLESPPVIDGVIDLADDFWGRAGGAAGRNWRVQFDANLEDLLRGGELMSGAPPIDAIDIGFDIMAGYDDDNLYIAVKVYDDIISTDTAPFGSEDGQTWLDDSVEIFIDGDNSNFQERETADPAVVDTGGQFVITAGGAYRDSEAGNPGYGENAAWYAQTGIVADGYEAEFRISWDILGGKPADGESIGFSVGVNDDDDGGDRERQLMWVGAPHTEKTYGNLVIGGKVYEAFGTAAPTIDGAIHAAEYPGAETIIVNGWTGKYDIPSGDDDFPYGDHSFEAWVTHDADHVYVAVSVTDDTIVTDTAGAGSEDEQTWLDDSIEIFFDVDNSDDDGRGPLEFEGQYVFTPNGARRDNEANNPTFGADADWFAATTLTDTGYAVEFQFSKSALLNPIEGTIMGFNITLNDDDEGGNARKAQLNWSGRPHSEFTYGTLLLGGPSPVSGPANLRIRLEDSQIVLQWDGAGRTLETASSVNGAWTPVEGAASPFQSTLSETKTFFRTKDE